MPTQPPEPPESIVLSNFKGIRNTSARERLAPEEFESAVNVDIDDAGQVRRRRGYTLKHSGDFHSVATVGDRVLGVKNGELGVIGTDYTFTGYGTQVGTERLSYTQVGGTTYFSSLAASGKIATDTVQPWGAVADAGEWVSPVMTPTDTLGEVFGMQITAPPLAQEIEYYNGRIYLAAGPYLWATELWMYDYTQKTRNFIQFTADITLLSRATDGLYVGTTEGLYFLKGTMSEGFQQSRVIDGGVVRGSGTHLPTSNAYPAEKSTPVPDGVATYCLTTKGICACFDGGQVFNLTYGRMSPPDAASAAVLYREDLGCSSYVAVLNSAGGPAANARIGDYVDAEIVRATDRLRG